LGTTQGDLGAGRHGRRVSGSGATRKATNRGCAPDQICLAIRA
jgi:hypothetical protein